MEGCRFCLENAALADAPLWGGDGFFVLGMLDPARQHGVMIVPKRHVETPFDLEAADWAALPPALAFARDHLARFAPDGFSVGWNIGAAAGQTVRHAHMHVICRFATEAAAGSGLYGLIKAANAQE